MNKYIRKNHERGETFLETHAWCLNRLSDMILLENNEEK